ncbi:MAG: DUF3696 domain-containing protein, partial [Spirochaetota bacterium]
MLDKIRFRKYKSYRDWQELQLKPLTIVFGKNSSGKSAIVRLPTLLETSLSGEISEPVQLNNYGIELGAEFRELIYSKVDTDSLDFELFQKEQKLSVSVLANREASGEKSPKITSW